MKFKRCVSCNVVKSEDNFHVRAREKDGLAYYCKECTKGRSRKYRSETVEQNRERARRWRQANPDKARATHDRWIANNRERAAKSHKFRQLRHRYGLSREAYENLMRESGGKCQLCGGEQRLCVDHCHNSSVVRGILCLRCNTAIERFESVPEFPRLAAEYLEKHNEPR